MSSFPESVLFNELMQEYDVFIRKFQEDKNNPRSQSKQHSSEDLPNSMLIYGIRVDVSMVKKAYRQLIENLSKIQEYDTVLLTVG